MNLDTCAKYVFDNAIPMRKPSIVSWCRNCMNNKLAAIYNERRLYTVICDNCDEIHLVKTSSEVEALARIGIRFQDADSWCEDYGDCLFFEVDAAGDLSDAPIFTTPMTFEPDATTPILDPHKDWVFVQVPIPHFFKKDDLHHDYDD